MFTIILYFHKNIFNKGESVPFVDDVLSLGVVLDDALSWKQQIQHVPKKFNKTLYGLKFIKSCTLQ